MVEPPCAEFFASSDNVDCRPRASSLDAHPETPDAPDMGAVLCCEVQNCVCVMVQRSDGESQTQTVVRRNSDFCADPSGSCFFCYGQNRHYIHRCACHFAPCVCSLCETSMLCKYCFPSGRCIISEAQRFVVEAVYPQHENDPFDKELNTTEQALHARLVTVLDNAATYREGMERCERIMQPYVDMMARHKVESEQTLREVCASAATESPEDGAPRPQAEKSTPSKRGSADLASLPFPAARRHRRHRSFVEPPER